MATTTTFLSRFRTVTYQLKGIATLVVLTLCFIGYQGISGMEKATNSIEDLYSQGMQHTIRAGKILDELGDARGHLLLALQHAPNSESASLHDHPITFHIDEVTQSLKTLHHIVDNEIMPSALSPLERNQVSQLVMVLDKISDDGFGPALQALRDNRFSQANMLLLNAINPLFVDISKEAETFLAMQVEEGKTATIRQWQMPTTLCGWWAASSLSLCWCCLGCSQKSSSA